MSVYSFETLLQIILQFFCNSLVSKNVFLDMSLLFYFPYLEQKRHVTLLQKKLCISVIHIIFRLSFPDITIFQFKEFLHIVTSDILYLMGQRTLLRWDANVVGSGLVLYLLCTGYGKVCTKLPNG